MNYFAPKWLVYVMIWLPRTTDNSTYFAQSLEIRGMESRLYIQYVPRSYGVDHLFYHKISVWFYVVECNNPESLPFCTPFLIFFFLYFSYKICDSQNTAEMVNRVNTDQTAPTRLF